MKICPNCGTENEDSSVYCTSCGTRLPELAVSTTGEPIPPPSPPPPPTGATYGSPVAMEGRPSQTALWSMILGIISVVCCCIGIVPGVIAIVLAVQARKDPQANQSMATAGLVLGIIGTALNVIGVINGIVNPNTMQFPRY